MRASTSAFFFAREGQRATMEAGRGISALTHGDPAAGEGCAIFDELIRRSLEGDDALASLPDEVSPEFRLKWAEVLREDWHPSMATETNGAAWILIGAPIGPTKTMTAGAKAIAVLRLNA